MDNKKILLITGGYINKEVLEAHLSGNDYRYIIAIDKGLVVADDLDIKLDYIVGDFDSVPSNIFIKYKELPEVIIYPRVKDETDTELGLNLAIELGHEYAIDEIHIIGATGTRIDHLLVNIYLLKNSNDQGINAIIIDEYNKIYLKDKSFSIRKSNQYGDFISLIPYSDEIEIQSLKGFKYELDNKTFYMNSSLGISNEIVLDEAFVEFEGGILIVIESKD